MASLKISNGLFYPIFVYAV